MKKIAGRNNSYNTFFLFSALHINQGCLIRLEDLLMACIKEMQPNCHLWFAFQPNTLKDFNPELPEEWPQMISEMKSRLETHFYVPTLSNNLRNSSEVFNMTEVVKTEAAGWKSDVKDSLGVTTVAMTIHATTPKLIPILEKEQDKVMGDAIMFAIDQTREETGEPNSCFVILHDEMYQTEEIFNSIQSKKSPDDSLFKYPPNQEDESPSIDYLDDLMENKTQGMLVLRDKTFKGAEAMNIIIIMDDGGSISDLRCNMLRCISHLSIILAIQEHEFLKFDKVQMFDKFLTCMKECEEFIFQCSTCLEEQFNKCGEQQKKNTFYCKSCKMRKTCHPIDHEFKYLSVEKVLKRKQVKCGCHCNK